MNDNKSGLNPEDVEKLQQKIKEIEDKISNNQHFIHELIKEKTLLEFKIYSYEINYYLPNF